VPPRQRELSTLSLCHAARRVLWGTWRVAPILRAGTSGGAASRLRRDATSARDRLSDRIEGGVGARGRRFTHDETDRGKSGLVRRSRERNDAATQARNLPATRSGRWLIPRSGEGTAAGVRPSQVERPVSGLDRQGGRREEGGRPPVRHAIGPEAIGVRGIPGPASPGGGLARAPQSRDPPLQAARRGIRRGRVR